MDELLLSCPFCGGPPKPIVTRAFHPYGYLPIAEIDADNGTYAEAYVFCHECGAEGPKAEECIHSEAGHDALALAGIRNWQDRDQRHADLYQSSAAAGRSHFPRKDLP